MGKISTSSRYIIDITGLDPLSLGDFQCFGDFGASGCARTIKIGSRVRYLDFFDLITVVSPIRPSMGLEREEKLKKIRYF